MAVTPGDPEPVEPYADYDADIEADLDGSLPPRKRFRFLSPVTASLMALILGGVGFYVGIRVEKSKVGSSGGSSSAFARLSTGAAGTSTGSRSSTTSSRSGTLSSRFAAGGFAGAAGALAGAGTVGSISSVDGDTLYVTTSSGNTVKVKLSGATTITKSESVGKGKLNPGDAVVIAGASGSGGTVAATSVTDSGASSTGSGSGSASSSGSSGSSAASAIASLFGGG